MTYPLSKPIPPASGAQQRAYLSYVAIVFSGLALLVLLLVFIAVSFGQPSGDLGRISGFGSRDFGSQQDEITFTEDHFTYQTYQEFLAVSGPRDIVVFGDSVSRIRPYETSWLNTLAEMSGLQVASVSGTPVSGALTYLISDEFKSYPPQAVILQTIERQAVQRLLSIYNPKTCVALPDDQPSRLPVAADTAFPKRILEAPDGSFASIDDLFSFGALSLRTQLKGDAKAAIRDLNRDDLFSNVAADRLLLYSDDYGNHEPEHFPGLSVSKVEEQMACALGGLFAAAGDVPLWLVVAPDKRSVYQPWIASDDPPKFIDVFSYLDNVLGARFINLRPVLVQAVETGEKDVYWPDDTHWGPSGNALSGRVIATTILDFPKAQDP